ncbi:PsbP domain-containing protein 1 [Chlorella vulgaris]
MASAAARPRWEASVTCQQRPQQQQQQQQPQLAVTRRSLLALPAGLAAAAALARAAPPAHAFVMPPPGYRYHEDKLDGYNFFYPEDWQPVTTSGNDVFYRNPFDVSENLFVNVSSPSSSKYETVADFGGSPEAAAKKTEAQYLEEFMSTRLGVRRTTEVVSATARTAPDGKLYYDLQTRAKSYASRNQLAVTQREIDDGVVLEWDRRYIAVLGVADKRLYEFRLQVSNAAYEADPERLLTIARSFRCKEV